VDEQMLRPKLKLLPILTLGNTSLMILKSSHF
jgi:hypothetical protein